MFLFSCNKSAFVFGLLRVRRNTSSLFKKKKKEREGGFRVLFQFSPSKSQSVAAKSFFPPHFFQKADLSRVLLSRVSKKRDTLKTKTKTTSIFLSRERERVKRAFLCDRELEFKNLNRRYIFILQAFLSDEAKLESKK